ncbi:hypothetical protein [Undibacterium sp. TJN19]|uniref:hypothetical protein n=1 Tax=Undibacterium sp. TJN19 TaxID=3413055 RepID=UPI003BF082B1
MLATLSLSAVVMAQQSLPPPSPDFVRGLQVMREDGNRTQTIESFALKAKTGDVDAVLAMFVPEARASEGDDEIRKYISKNIIPFFSAYEKLHNYSYIEPRTMPDGRTGYRYYTYFVNSQSGKTPFDIIIMEVNGMYLIANFNARGCIKGKHPICD